MDDVVNNYEVKKNELVQLLEKASLESASNNLRMFFCKTAINWKGTGISASSIPNYSKRDIKHCTAKCNLKLEKCHVERL